MVSAVAVVVTVALNQTAVWVAAALLVLLMFSSYALRSWSPRVASLGADGRHHRLYHRRRLHHDRPDRMVLPRTGVGFGWLALWVQAFS